MIDPEIASRFFNFPPETLQLIADYRRSKDPALVTPILQGIVKKYAPEIAPEAVAGIPKVQNAFGLESITLLEVVLDLQDAFEITLSDQELQSLQTMDETVALISDKVAALKKKAP